LRDHKPKANGKPKNGENQEQKKTNELADPPQLLKAKRSTERPKNEGLKKLGGVGEVGLSLLRSRRIRPE